MQYHYDLLVLGAGSGGLAASKRAASYGKKVAIIEKDKVGGTCVIRGCVPKKIMMFASQLNEQMSDAKGYGFEGEAPQLNFNTFVQKRNAEIARLNALHISYLEKAGVELILGEGKFKDPHTIEVNGKTYTAEKIIIACGGRPFVPAHIKGAAENSITSDGIWGLEQLPAHITIVGAGYIALEFASIFNALGAEVHVILRKKQILRGFDQDICATLQEEMVKRGVHFHTETEVENIEKNANGEYTLTLSNGDTLITNQTIFATGRVPNTDLIQINKANVILNEDGSIPVNKKLQTNMAHIYAIGDILNRTNLTPVAIKHGRMVAENLYNSKNLVVDDESPCAIFTTPQVASTGLSEQQAIEQFGADDITTHFSRFRPMFYVLAERNEKDMMKLVVRKSTGTVLGCHMVGKDAAEIIQGFAVAVRAKLTKADFDATVAIHPSSAEEFVLM